jgi:hypothetical protein
VAKARALNKEGITAYHWAGSYRVPVTTVTGSVQGDLCLIESCVGVGEVAVSDHRSSAPSPHELARIARQARDPPVFAPFHQWQSAPALLLLELCKAGCLPCFGALGADSVATMPCVA